MCAQVRSRAEGNRTEGGSGVKHRPRFVPWKMGVVYRLSLYCGNNYVGQSGRCVNPRLGEHRRSLKATTYTRLADHCRACGNAFYPLLKETTVLSRHARQTGREIIEALHIRRLGANWVSQTSIALSDTEYAYLASPCLGS